MRLGSAEDRRAAASGVEPIVQTVVLDLAGTRVDLTSSEAARLRDVAAAEAGRSSRARDLAVLLDRALVLRHTLALRPAERQTLARIAAEAGLSELAELGSR